MSNVKPSQERIILSSAGEYFQKLVHEGFENRKVNTYPHVRKYIVELLNFYVDARNFFDEEINETGEKPPQTLAEMYMVASQSEPPIKNNILKKLGDRCLYISGFFGDSLQRKVVDIDYYMQMGASAYSSLASLTKEDTTAKVYHAISNNFIDITDVLTYISHKSFAQTNQGILRLYDRYLKTGSELAKEKLIEMGVITVPLSPIKISKPS